MNKKKKRKVLIMILLGILLAVLALIALPFILVAGVGLFVFGDIAVAIIAIYIVIRLIKKFNNKKKS
jgi:biotin transporter BioY